MIRALRRSQAEWPGNRRRRRENSPPATARPSSSAAFSRRSLGLSTAARFPRRTASGPVAAPAPLAVSTPTPPSSIATSATPPSSHPHAHPTHPPPHQNHNNATTGTTTTTTSTTNNSHAIPNHTQSHHNYHQQQRHQHHHHHLQQHHHPLAPPTHDPLALVRRLPPRISAHVLVKSARAPAFFGRFEPYWAELRGRLVVLVVPPERVATASANASASPTSPVTTSPSAAAAENLLPPTSPRTSSRSRLSPKDEPVIAAVLTVERAQISRPRGPKTPLLKLSNPRVPHHHVWLRFQSDADARVWEKALAVVAAERVVGISDFEFISPIGKGASGKVFLVADRSTGDKLALKVIDKAKVFESRSAFRHALDERLALEMVDGHPFFSRLRYAFQTRAYFYLAIDFYDGGDLYQYLCTHGRLREPQVRAVAAEVALALEHLHKLGFVYRDLKPENVLLDSRGHIRLADFGLCKLLPDRAMTDTICGTHTYAAPEMLSVRKYGKSIDLWAFGVFVYHVLRGRTPYEARDLDQVIANMNNRRIRFLTSTSDELVSMIRKLLDWNPETRLGCGAGAMVEVRGHSFFNGVDWRKVYSKDSDDTGLVTRVRKQRDEPAGGSSGRVGGARRGGVGGGGTNTRISSSVANGGVARQSSAATSGPNSMSNGVLAGGSLPAGATSVGTQTGALTGGSSNVVGSPTEGDTSGSNNNGGGGGGVCAEVSAANDGGEAPSTEVLTGGADVGNVSSGAAGCGLLEGDTLGDADAPVSSDTDQHRVVGGGSGSGGVIVGERGGGSVASGSMSAGVSATASASGSRLMRRRRSATGAGRRRSVVSMGRSRGRNRQGKNGASSGGGIFGTGGGVGGGRNGPMGGSSGAMGEMKSLREQMVAAAEEDDLRNFDMSEWGKISVDNDHDDASYGDGALWPLARARRKLVDDERMIAGFGYCSTSTPLGVPDYL